LEKGDPVNSCRFHGHRFDLTRNEPVGQGVQVLAKCVELPHRANVSFLGHGHIDLGGSNIDASGIGLNKWQTLLLLGFLFAVADHRVSSC